MTPAQSTSVIGLAAAGDETIPTRRSTTRESEPIGRRRAGPGHGSRMADGVDQRAHRSTRTAAAQGSQRLVGRPRVFRRALSFEEDHRALGHDAKIASGVTEAHSHFCEQAFRARPR